MWTRQRERCRNVSEIVGVSKVEYTETTMQCGRSAGVSSQRERAGTGKPW